MSLQKRAYYSDNERNSVRIVALVSLFFVGFSSRVATLVSPYKTLEDEESSTLEPLPLHLSTGAQSRPRYDGGGVQSRPRYDGGGVRGMSYVYYINSCPRAYDVVRERMQLYTAKDPSQAAGILHLFFHDCFVQGCDASILLARVEGSEQRAPPNFNALRATSLHIINEIKNSLEVACPGVVSCADTLALAARDAIFMVGGPWIPIMTGRKDSIIAASNATVMANIPPPTLGFLGLARMFASKGLNVKDLVALSGAHTIGQTHCSIADSQLTPTMSSDLSPAFGANLSQICLSHHHPDARKSHLTAHLDSLTPNTFDNTFFQNVLMKRAIFHSDAALLQDDEALYYVRTFAVNQAQFFRQFRLSFLKMSQLGVLANTAGEVRMRCTIPN